MSHVQSRGRSSTCCSRQTETRDNQFLANKSVRKIIAANQSEYLESWSPDITSGLASVPQAPVTQSNLSFDISFIWLSSKHMTLEFTVHIRRRNVVQHSCHYSKRFSCNLCCLKHVHKNVSPPTQVCLQYVSCLLIH